MMVEKLYTRVQLPSGGKRYIPKAHNKFLHRVCRTATDAQNYAQAVLDRLGKLRQARMTSDQEK